MNSSGFAQFIPLILIFVIFYFFLIRPQQKRVKDHRAMVQSLKRGDEVITVSHTATATVSAIVATGATPILVDINKDDFCMNLEHLDKSITKKTKAIIPVHLYGQMVNMKELIKISKKYKIDIIEDSSQSHGASYDNKKSGSFGKLSCFSFYPTKNLGCYGDGGAITTNSKSLYNKLLMMREYGWKPKFNSISYGLNSRLDEIHASVLKIKLKKLRSRRKTWHSFQN